MKRIVLVTGGSRSGKSSQALELAARYGRRAFIATAEALDREMRARINEHRRIRDASFHTVEEPIDLAAALKAVPLGVEVAVIDCITVWLGNLFYHQRVKDGTAPEIEAFLASLKAPPCNLIVVTNELGMGIIPADPETRLFRDVAGRVNQQLARLADEVILTVCGIPLQLKCMK
jgi:adenosylcobinamide kinase/adenosylcobinamide-phosphate guanylyltransferase